MDHSRMEAMVKITAATPVKLLLTAYPQASAAFIQNHMACVGCPMSNFETLRETAQNYRLSLDVFLAQINALVSPPTGR